MGQKKVDMRQGDIYQAPDGLLIEISTPAHNPSEKVQFHLQGGGFVQTLALAQFNELFKPSTLPTDYKPALIIGDWMESPVAGYVTGQRWNGWVMPAFTHEAGIELIQENPNLSFDAERDAFVATLDGFPPGEDVEVYAAILVLVQGKQVKLYPIGAGSWCWELCESPSQRPAQAD